jgi:hypothetical protein
MHHDLSRWRSKLTLTVDANNSVKTRSYVPTSHADRRPRDRFREDSAQNTFSSTVAALINGAAPFNTFSSCHPGRSTWVATVHLQRSYDAGVDVDGCRELHGEHRGPRHRGRDRRALPHRGEDRELHLGHGGREDQPVKRLVAHALAIAIGACAGARPDAGRRDGKPEAGHRRDHERRDQRHDDRRDDAELGAFTTLTANSAITGTGTGVNYLLGALGVNTTAPNSIGFDVVSYWRASTRQPAAASAPLASSRTRSGARSASPTRRRPISAA